MTPASLMDFSTFSKALTFGERNHRLTKEEKQKLRDLYCDKAYSGKQLREIEAKTGMKIRDGRLNEKEKK